MTEIDSEMTIILKKISGEAVNKEIGHHNHQASKEPPRNDELFVLPLCLAHPGQEPYADWQTLLVWWLLSARSLWLRSKPQ